MTTTSERYLQKQIERRDNQIKLLVEAFNAAVDESEFRASVACGFAWDLTTSQWQWAVDKDDKLDCFCTYTFNTPDWDESVAAMEASNQEPK